MNYDYDSAMFYEITFPTRNVSVALIKPNDIKRIAETKEGNKIVTNIFVRKNDKDEIVYCYDGELEEFKKHCKKVYL